MKKGISSVQVGTVRRLLHITEPLEKHMAIPGFIYGGLIASFVDCHGTGSWRLLCTGKMVMNQGMAREVPRFVTASLNVNYLKPTPQGKLLKAVGTIEEITRRNGK